MSNFEETFAEMKSQPSETLMLATGTSDGLDPQQRLSQQPHLVEFTLFPKLTIEIHFLIWHHTFPKSRWINLGTPDVLYRTQHAGNSDNKLIPISMWVHRESRRETMSHYKVFHYQPQLRALHNDKPLVLNLAHDKFHLNYNGWAPLGTIGNYEWNLVDHLKALDKHLPGCLSKIHNLYVSNIALPSWRRLYEPLPMWPPLDHLVPFWNEVFTWFPNLRKIAVTAAANRPLKRFLEKNKDKFVDGEITEVVVERSFR